MRGSAVCESDGRSSLDVGKTNAKLTLWSARGDDGVRCLERRVRRNDAIRAEGGAVAVPLRIARSTCTDSKTGFRQTLTEFAAAARISQRSFLSHTAPPRCWPTAIGSSLHRWTMRTSPRRRAR